ncbi:phage head closure protein [Cupriavidus sp. RAF12]|uniref:phage head closure protein n=1 Tax=Cupriavidus sp. RAF12 TaxID=3233050 RepID=UPI003F8DF639
MEIGRLRNLVTIQRLVAGQDEIGEPVSTWVDVATVWANVAHKSGLESIKADAPVSVVQASIRIRYRTDIDAGMRALCGAAVYDIRAAIPDVAGRQFTDLVCETGASEG